MTKMNIASFSVTPVFDKTLPWIFAMIGCCALLFVTKSSSTILLSRVAEKVV